jgi:hypothetical protein
MSGKSTHNCLIADWKSADPVICVGMSDMPVGIIYHGTGSSNDVDRSGSNVGMLTSRTSPSTLYASAVLICAASRSIGVVGSGCVMNLWRNVVYSSWCFMSVSMARMTSYPTLDWKGKIQKSNNIDLFTISSKTSTLTDDNVVLLGFSDAVSPILRGKCSRHQAATLSDA